MHSYKLLIGGSLVDGDLSLEVVNPATEEILAVAPRASIGQLDAAVAAAKAAFPAWSRKSLVERGEYLRRIADAIDARRSEFARLLTEEQGKPLAEADAEIGFTSLFFRQFSALELPNRVIEEGPDRRVEVRRLPLGVVGAIIPWNFPMLIIAFKVPLALLAGNTVVLKPSPTTPLTALKLGELLREILPAGVVNIIVDQNDLGAHLTSHFDVAKISFTGSTETGRKVMASAAASIKRLTLELGGNDAALVLPDVDAIETAKGLFASAFLNAGQVCIAVKRVYAHEAIYDELCEALKSLADETIVDDGLKQGTQIGPLQNKSQYEKVKGFIADARATGKIIAGGDVEDRPGFFIRPTIVRDIEDGARLVDEEQFGPILPIIRYSDVEDALARANASPWGLGGSVWSKDRDKGYELAGRMEAGMVWINKHLDFGPNIPFAGAKQSGIGVEFPEEGLNEFTQLQVINEAVG